MINPKILVSLLLLCQSVYAQVSDMGNTNFFFIPENYPNIRYLETLINNSVITDSTLEEVHSIVYLPNNEIFTPAQKIQSGHVIKTDLMTTNYLKNFTLKTMMGSGTRYGGTSVAIAENLILTNAHVLASPSNRCRSLKVKNNHNQEISCQKVLYCEHEYSKDFCLIKMDTNKHSLFDSYHNAPCLKGHIDREQNSKVYLLGNPIESSIYASIWRGYYRSGDSLIYFNLSWGGFSGSPLFNESLEIIGLHTGRRDWTQVGYTNDPLYPLRTIRESVESLSSNIVLPTDSRRVSRAIHSEYIYQKIKGFLISRNDLSHCQYQ